MDGAVGCGFLAIVLIGWVANVVFFIGQMGSEISSSVIISGVGILLAGAIF